MRQITKRFEKGSDLKESIINLAKENIVTAGVVVCSVGSLSKVNLRLAGATENLEKSGEFEIISVNGRIAKDGSHVHLHLSVSDHKGDVFGGHVKEGCIVRTTLELVILAFDNVVYTVGNDHKTGFKELFIK